MNFRFNYIQCSGVEAYLRGNGEVKWIKILHEVLNNMNAGLQEKNHE